MINETKLRALGWSDDEISHAKGVLARAEEEKHPWLKRLDVFIYWIVLAVAILGNIAFSVALVPALVALPSLHASIVIFITAGFFGFVCSYVIHKIDVIDHRHHLLYVFLVSIIGLLSFALVVQQANAAALTMRVGYTHGVWLSIAYFIAFFTPYGLIGGQR